MKKVITILLVTALVFNLRAQTKVDSLKQVYAERIKKLMHKNKVVGTSIVIVSGDSIIWKEGFGFADEENNEKITPSTLFGLGSVTKVFTATAVMQLVESNKINLDRPLGSYLRNFSIKGANVEDITPRNVLTHHSGLPSDIFKGMFTTKPEDYKSVLGYMNNEYIAATPNQVRAYSNPGYTLLGHMIHDVSSVEYQDFITSNIFEPLDMSISGFNLLEKSTKTFDSKGKYSKDVLLRDVPAGGLFSNADDLGRFLQAYLSRSSVLMSEDGYKEVYRNQHPDAVLDMGVKYGLGWNITSRPYTGNIYYHTGTTLYFNAAVAVAPEVDLAVAILTNSENGGRVYNQIHGILNDMARVMGKPVLESKDKVDLGSSSKIKLSAEQLKSFEGVYTAPGAYIKAYKKKKNLNIRLQGLRVVMLPVSENTFIPKIMLLGFIPIKMGDARFIFEEIGGMDVITLLEEGSPKELMAKKMESQELSQVWKDRTGEYEQVNLLDGEIKFFDDFKLQVKDGLLILSFEQVNNKSKMQMVMEIIDNDRAMISGVGRYAGQSLQDRGDVLSIFGIELTKKQ